MRKILEYFYLGNIIPCEQKMKSNSALRHATGAAAQRERELMERLSGAEQTMLIELIDAQHDIDGITAMENFILGFRLGMRMMAECMGGDDGDITEVTSHG